MSSHHRIWRRLVLLILTIMVGAVLLPTAHASPTTEQRFDNPRISGGYDPQISPDSQFVVYRERNLNNNALSLYSVPITGGTSIELSGSVIGNTTDAFEISPDSSTVVYISGYYPNPRELYSVPITGGTPTKLSNHPVEDLGVSWATISPDNSTVVYISRDKDYIIELYSVPINGGTPTKLNPSLTSNSGFTISPDSSTVVYATDQDTDNIEDLYAIPISGGTATKLSNHPVEESEQEISTYLISPDGTTVIYHTTGNDDLYQVPITGGTPELLDSSVNWNVIQFSPDSSNVVYREKGRMRRIPLEWGAVFHIHPYNSGGYYDLPDFSISPDSSRVVFRTRNSDDPRHTELHSATVSPGGPGGRRLDPYVSTGFHVTSFEISPDSSTVVYIGRPDINIIGELYAVPITGGSRIKLNAPLESGSYVNDLVISPDSSTVVYRVYNSNGTTDLYAVPITGGTATLLNPSNDTGIKRFADYLIISPDSSTVVYNWTHRSDKKLYAMPIVGGTPVRLN